MKVTTQLTIDERSPAFFTLKVWTNNRILGRKLTSGDFIFVGERPKPQGKIAKLLRLAPAVEKCYHNTYGRHQTLALLATFDCLKQMGMPLPCALFEVKGGNSFLVGNYTVSTSKDGRGLVTKSYAWHPDWAVGKVRT